MPLRPFRDLVPGGQISAGEQNRAFRATEAGARSDVGGQLASQLGPGGSVVTSLAPRRTKIQITSGGNPYAYTEIVHQQTSSTTQPPAAVTTGLSGLAAKGSMPAWELNGNGSVPVGTIVEAWVDAASECLFFSHPAASSGGSSSCQVSNAAAQSIPSSALTVVTFDTEQWDTPGWHDVTTNNNRITPTAAGYYLAEFYGVFATNSTGLRRVDLHVSGFGASSACQMDFQPSAVVPTPIFFSKVFRLIFPATDYFEVSVYQTSGGDLALTQHTLTVTKVG